MPIIREERQYKIGPVGVSRAYEGGKTAEAIARGADQMAGYFFKIAAEDAEQKGVELAQSVNRDELLTIDPTTGQPAAMARVNDMGRVASQAYTRVLQDRYRQSIEEEIRNQATILAGQYENNDNGVALYQTAMSDYIAEMSKNATGIYQGYIEDFGTSYINSTSASMTVNQLRRTRAELADSVTRSYQESLQSVLGWYAQNGPEADDAPSLGRAMIESSQTGVNDAASAGVLGEGAPTSASRELAVYRAAGIVQNFVTNGRLSSAEIMALNGAIGSQDIAAIRRISPELADYIEPIASDYASFSALEPITDSFLRDSASVAEFDERQAAQLALQQDTQRAFQLASNDNYFGMLTSDAVANRFDVYGATGMTAYDTTINSFRQNYDAIGRAAANANEQTAAALNNRRNTLTAATVDGITQYLLRDGATDERIQYLQAAISEGGEGVALRREDAAAIRALREIDRIVGGGVLSDLSSGLVQYKERASPFYNDQADRQAQEVFNETILPSLTELRDSRGAGTQQLFGEVITAIDNAGLNDSDRESAIKNANFHAMEGRINEFFDYANLDENIVAAASRYAQGREVAGDELPLYFKQLIDDAQNYWSGSEQRSALATEFNRRADQWRSDQTREQRNADRQRLQFEVSNGIADGTRQESRQAADDLLNTQYRAAFNQDLPNDFFTNPAYVQDERFAEMFRVAYSMNSTLPESAFNVFRAVASGSVGPNVDIQTVMTHWDQMSLYEIDGGAKVIRAPSVNAMAERDIAILDYISSSMNITGASSADINQAIIDAQRVFRDPNYEENVRAFIGNDYNSLEAYLSSEVEGYNDLSVQDRRSIRARFDGIYGVATAMERSPSSVAEELSRQVERSFPSGDGIVMAFTPDGRITDRTRYALSAVMPENEQVFKEHVLAGISELAPSVNARFAPEGLFSFNIQGYSPFSNLVDLFSGFMSRDPEDVMASRADYVFLAPVGPTVNGETIYGVYQVDPISGGVQFVPREDGENAGMPLMFSTAELRDAQILASSRSVMRRNQLVRWQQTGTELEGLYDMFDGQVNPDLLLQEN